MWSGGSRRRAAPHLRCQAAAAAARRQRQGMRERRIFCGFFELRIGSHAWPGNGSRHPAWRDCPPPPSSDGSAAPWRLTSVTTERLDGKFAFGLLTGLPPMAFGCPFHSPNPEGRPSLRWACLKGVAPDPPSECPRGPVLLLTSGALLFSLALQIPQSRGRDAARHCAARSALAASLGAGPRLSKCASMRARLSHPTVFFAQSLPREIFRERALFHGVFCVE
ncbi:hypothetical protein L1887_54074 [Cichorium endivia]|nr:hypothetical protein L1887_54074 [Cichorium endivia]